MLMNPDYPIYIVSKGRWESRLTSKALERMNVPYFIIIEEQEYDQYASVIDSQKILVLPRHYLENYDTFDNLGFIKSKGPGSARNFAWDHSISINAPWHWVMDDNIASFQRLNRNLMVKVTNGAIFKASEDFVHRYENLAIAGFNYDFFCQSKEKHPPFILNTRIYSCLLIRNDIPYRWRGRYNEDTDLSLRALKDGWCTIQFNAFIQEKAQTQTMKGGNSDEFYFKEGTMPKSQMLADMHPDVAKVVWKFNRWHHHVDYRAFKKNRLRFKPDLNIPDAINNYGMKLVTIK
jgi:hypothetical protein